MNDTRPESIPRALTAVTVNWNGGSLVMDAVDSLARCRKLVPLDLVFIDNASEDGSGKAVTARYTRESWFHHIENKANIGYAAAANQGMRRAIGSGRDVLLFNPDAVIEPESLTRLRGGLERHPRAALAAPRLLNPAGSLQPSLRDFPTPLNLLREHLLPASLCAAHVASCDPHDRERSADWIVGAVWLVRREALEAVGLFDEDFGTFHEETDLARRFDDADWESWLVPGADARHAGGALHSNDPARREAVVLKYIPGKLRYLAKHHGAGTLFTFRVGNTALWLSRLLAAPQSRDRRRFARKAIRLTWGPAAKTFRNS